MIFSVFLGRCRLVGAVLATGTLFLRIAAQRLFHTSTGRRGAIYYCIIVFLFLVRGTVSSIRAIPYEINVF